MPATPGAFPAPPELANGPEDSGCLKVEEFFQDPLLLGLIRQGVAGNLEQKIRAQEAQIADDEVLWRSGTYLPLVSAGGGAGLNKVSSFTVEGAGIRDDP